MGLDCTVSPGLSNTSALLQRSSQKGQRNIHIPKGESSGSGAHSGTPNGSPEEGITLLNYDFHPVGAGTICTFRNFWSLEAGGSSWPRALQLIKPKKMPGFFLSHNNMTELNGKEDCKLAEGKVHKKKQRAFGADLKSYLKCMVPHIESGIKTSNSRNVMLSAEEVIQWSQSLEKLLASQSGQGVFREFLKSEFSEENIEFWLACEDYKRTKSDHLHGKAERIYEEFVQSDAIKQINIDYQMREATAKKAQDPTHTSFDEAQKTVYILMERDSYPRFLKSKSYLNLLNQLQTNTSK